MGFELMISPMLGLFYHLSYLPTTRQLGADHNIRVGDE